MTQLEHALKDVKPARLFKKELPIMGKFLEDNLITIVDIEIYDYKAALSLRQKDTPFGMKVWWGPGFAHYISLCRVNPTSGWSEQNCAAIIWKGGKFRHDLLGVLLGEGLGFQRE